MADNEQPAVRRLKVTVTDVTPPPRTMKVTETDVTPPPIKLRLPAEEPYEPVPHTTRRTWPFK